MFFLTKVRARTARKIFGLKDTRLKNIRLLRFELERKSYTLKTIHGKYVFESTPLQPCSPLLHFETVTKYKKTEPFSPLVPCVVVLAFFEIPSASVILMRIYWCSQKWNSRLGLPSLQAVASRCLSPYPGSIVRIRGSIERRPRYAIGVHQGIGEREGLHIMSHSTLPTSGGMGRSNQKLNENGRQTKIKIEWQFYCSNQKYFL